jgi:uncharacterized protein (DUF1778 family)
MPARTQKKTKSLRETPLQIRLTDQEKTTFAAAADREHMSLSAWVRKAAWHAAESKHALG